MVQLFTPNPMDLDLGFTGDETESDLNGAASGTEDDAPEPALAPAPEAPSSTPAPEAATPPASPEGVQTPQIPAASTATPSGATEPVAQSDLAAILRRMEESANRQTQILERAVPQPAVVPTPKPLPVVPAQYRGVIDDDTLRGAQVVMEALGISQKLDRLEQFEQAQNQRDTQNAAGAFITSQVPEMKDPAFQNEVAAEVERNFDLAGVPKDQRAPFLSPFLFVLAGNAVKARRSQNAAVPTETPAPASTITQALSSRAGGETQTGSVAGSVADSSEQPVDWMDMSEEDYTKKQAAILKKKNGSW